MTTPTPPLEDSQSSQIESVLYSAGTDVGMRREENQDSYGIMLGEGYRLFIVADGMGGVKGGSIASNLAIAVVERTLRDRAHLQIDDILEAVRKANEEVFQKGNTDESLQGMGTTFAALFVTPRAAYTIHVGDSRIYQISKDGQITQLTDDHTLVQELVRSGAISEEQAEHHPVAHMLTRSIGPSEKVEIEMHALHPAPVAGDKFLICSDGLYNLVKSAEIAQIVSEVSTDEAVQYLIDLANERGGTDNITILLVDSNKYAPQSSSVSKPAAASPVFNSRLIESIETVTAPQPVYAMKGGYHSTNEVIEDAKEAPAVSAPDKEVHVLQEEPAVVQAVEPQEQIHELIDEVASDTAQEQHVDEFFEEEQEDMLEVAPAPAVSRRYLLVGSGFLGGLFASYLLFTTLNHNHAPHGDTEAPVEIAETVELAQKPKRVAAAPVIETVKIGPAEKASVLKRRRDLELTLRDIDVRLALLSAEKASDVESMQRTALRKAGELSGKIDQLRTDIEVAIRQLATWYDRKRRLETSDKVNMASELAPSVPVIKAKKEEFEKITWDYLKEVEALRYSQTDPLREQVLADLAKKRADKMAELSDEVRRSIEKSLESADDTVAELTLQRSAYEKELENVKQELDFARTIAGNDTLKVESLRQTLLTRQKASATELNELQRLLAENE